MSDTFNMNIVLKARYLGTPGILGLKKNRDYLIIIEESDLYPYVIKIQSELSNQGSNIGCDDGEIENEIWYPFSSKASVMRNWKILE